MGKTTGKDQVAGRRIVTRNRKCIGAVTSTLKFCVFTRRIRDIVVCRINRICGCDRGERSGSSYYSRVPQIRDRASKFVKKRHIDLRIPIIKSIFYVIVDRVKLSWPRHENKFSRRKLSRSQGAKEIRVTMGLKYLRCPGTEKPNV